KPGQAPAPLLESNLSATVYVLDALRTAGVKSDDPAFKKALVFVQRCQNFAGDDKEADPKFDDGGFFFIYDDPVRNKAGLVGKDKHGRERFISYGSMTADGWRALLLCGLGPDHARVKAARQWIEKNFAVDKHPGNYPEDREVSRPSVYFYYCL